MPSSKLTPEVSGTLRTFAFWIANGTVGLPLLDGIDYRTVILEEPSLLEAAFAVFANVLELDERGAPINAKYAEHRAAQLIRRYCDASYEILPPLEDWEQALHMPPPREDPKPWPGVHS